LELVGDYRLLTKKHQLLNWEVENKTTDEMTGTPQKGLI
jgi:hypothetical protein